jgi:predicted nucleotidyltransferase
MSDYKGLNGYSIFEIKDYVSKKFGYDHNNIRLFGSRIFGDYKPDSDLDITILDEERLDEPHIIDYFNELKLDIGFTIDLEQSWLWYSV